MLIKDYSLAKWKKKRERDTIKRCWYCNWWWTCWAYGQAGTSWPTVSYLCQQCFSTPPWLSWPNAPVPMSWAYYIAKGRARNNNQSVSQSDRPASRQPSIQSDVQYRWGWSTAIHSSHPVKKMNWPNHNYQSAGQTGRQTEKASNPAACSIQTTPQLRQRGNSFSLADTFLKILPVVWLRRLVSTCPPVPIHVCPQPHGDPSPMLSYQGGGW